MKKQVLPLASRINCCRQSVAAINYEIQTLAEEVAARMVKLIESRERNEKSMRRLIKMESKSKDHG